jgi:hypothetical protein
VQTGVSTAFTVISQDQDLGKAFIQAGVNIAANVAGAKLANEIGAGFRGGDFGWVAHKLFHAILGAGIGAAANLEDPGKGALGGATAAIAETVVEQLPKDFSKELRKGIAVMSAATVALITGGDVNAAGLAATNAVENNHLRDVHTGQLANETSAEEFVETLLDEWVETYGEITDGKREKLREQFTSNYEMLKVMDFSRSALAPDQERFNHLAGLSRDEFVTEMMDTWAQQGKINEDTRPQAVANADKFYDEIQAKKVVLGAAAFLMAGAGGIRGVGKAPTPAAGKEPANHNAAKPATVDKKKSEAVKKTEKKDNAKVTREKRWMQLANEPNSQLPKEMVDHVKRHNGKKVKTRFGQELAHKPKKAAAQGNDYAEALPKTVADHRIEHRYLKERKTGTIINVPKNSEVKKIPLPQDKK